MILNNIKRARRPLCSLFLGLVFSFGALGQENDELKDSITQGNQQIDQVKLTQLDLLVVTIERQFMQNPLGSKVFPVTAIGYKELESTNQFSMQDALNQLPGVKMDSRGYNGSRRLNLRGTLTRSPFGVRNVRMTMNGFPITSSDGASALELLEPADIREINIYKGPTGSYEMSGTGGVLATQLRTRKQGEYAVQIGAGEFQGNLGVARAYGAVGLGKNKFTGTLSAVYSENGGFRTHEANDKTQINFNGKYTVNNNRVYDLLAMVYDGYWELPGHLRLEAVEEDRTQSNTYSKEHDAHVARRRVYVGVHQFWRMSDRLSNDTWLFSHFTDKLNPYGTIRFFQGLKDENSNEFGGRTEFKYFPKRNSYVWEVKLGTQWQHFSTEIQEYINDFGIKGDLKYDNNTDITEGMVFGSLNWKPIEKFQATGQLGYNFYTINNDGVNADDQPLNFNVSNRQKLLPRIGASYQLFNRFTHVNLSYALGMAYPSIFEWVDTGSGQFSSTLNPEESENIELGFNTKLNNRRFDFGVNAYMAKVTETITERETEDGKTFFENAGESSQQGIEIQASYNGNLLEQNFTAYVSAAISDYQFVNDTSNLKLRIAGIAPITFAGGVKLMTQKVQADLHGRFISEIPTVIGEDTNPETDYFLLNCKFSYLVNEKSRAQLRVEAGVNNILDATYTSFFRLNAQGAIYNPMAGRNVFVGISLNRK